MPGTAASARNVAKIAVDWDGCWCSRCARTITDDIVIKFCVTCERWLCLDCEVRGDCKYARLPHSMVTYAVWRGRVRPTDDMR